MSYNICSALGTNWCTVSYIFLSLSIILLGLTVFFIQIFQYIKTSRVAYTLSVTYKLVFLSQLLETLLMTIHYLFLFSSSLTNISFLLQEYFISIQYSCVFYYFISQLCEAFKILRILPNIKLPLILVNATGILGFSIFTIIKTVLGDELYNCNDFLWVYLHTFNFCLSLIFLLIGLKANRLLKSLLSNKGLMVDDTRIKQFW
jgi:hypothetical protein